ncbi:sensor histidine kinase [Halorientalis marina]|jgi:nitrogen-specific signal transduction histidine kinase|uniref:sensor histidine kinase n=1 Tax=Halorientalis marina TaxID=2931976 RepID=UPI001FF55D79|nr:histidine kinase N-terminal 7TM domain-containing protein [Halorientalis marina]
MVLTALWLGGYALVAVTLAAFAYVYWDDRSVRGSEFLLLGATVATGTTLLYVGLLVVPSLPFKILVWKGVQTMSTIVLFCWFVFVVRWTGHERLSAWRSLALVALPLAVFDLLRLTNESPWVEGLHSLYWQSATIAEPVGLLVPIRFSFGVVDVLEIGYSALVVAATLALLVAFAARGEQRVYRARNALLATAPAAALATVAAFALLGVAFDPQPVAYVVGNTFVVIALLQFGAFDAVSLPEDGLLEAIDGGVLVYGTDGRVIDLNRLAKSVMGVSDDVVGREVVTTVEVADTLPNLRTDGAGTTAGGGSLRDPGSVGEMLDGHEFTTTVGGEARTFVVRVSRLTDTSDNHLGWTVLFYDVTDLRQKQQELDLLKQVLSRVLRHNVRNELTVIKANAKMLEEEGSGLAKERAGTIVEKSETLLDASEKARTVERLLEGDRDRSELDLVEVVESYIADEARATFPGTTFEVDLPASLRVEAHWALPVAVENVIENAAEHNDSDDPQVKVSVERQGSMAALKVADNGPGVSHAELEVLERREETQLEHGSGVGLWLVDWIVDLSQGNLTYETREPRGTVATVTVPALE